MKTKDAEALGR